MKHRVVAAIVGTAVLTIATYVGGPRLTDRGSDGSDGGSASARELASPGPAATDLQELDRLIGAYEDRLAARPDALEYTFLGRLYLDRARITGDVAAYDLATLSLEHATELAPRDLEAHTLLASSRFSTHDFSGALAASTEILGRDPAHLPAVAVAGDAHLELGAYEAAAMVYRRLADALPEAPAVQVRRARFAFLTGEIESARTLARRAESGAREAGERGAALAWYTVFRGELELSSGRYARAETLFRDALRTAPEDRHALAGLARSRAAEGDVAGAIGILERAAMQSPEPAHLSALGDLYRLAGRTDDAQQQYETVELIATLAGVNGQVFDRQLAVFYADHDLRPGEALRLARAELRQRRDVYGYDAYAWALYRNERYAEAADAAAMALRLGTPDARLHYHAGLIEAALGHRDLARRHIERALEISPEFDPLHARRARTVLAGLADGA